MKPEEVIGHVTAGANAGAAVELALYLLDAIKTRLQAARCGSRINLKHLYKGIGGNTLGAVPARAQPPGGMPPETAEDHQVPPRSENPGFL